MGRSKHLLLLATGWLLSLSAWAQIPNSYSREAIDAKVRSLTAADAATNARIDSFSGSSGTAVVSLTGVSYGQPVTITNYQHGQSVVHNLGTAHNLPSGTTFRAVFVPAGSPYQIPDLYVTFTKLDNDTLTISTPFDPGGGHERATGIVYVTSFPPGN